VLSTRPVNAYCPLVRDRLSAPRGVNSHAKIPICAKVFLPRAYALILVATSFRSSQRDVRALYALFAQPVAMAADVEHGGKAQQGIQNGSSEQHLGQDISPLTVGSAAGEDDAGLPVVATNRLEQKLGCLAIERETPQFVQDWQPGR
jgi:hypothetical protein